MKPYTDDLIAQVKSMLSSESYTDSQILEACNEITKGMTDGELAVLLDSQQDLCDRCAACCKVPAFVAITTEDLQRITHHLKRKKGMTTEQVLKKYKISWDGNEYYHIKGKPCTFFKEPNVCTIYDVRPGICMGYPAGSVINQMMQQGKPALHFDDFCHITKKFDAHRAIAWLTKTYQNQQPGKLDEALLSSSIITEDSELKRLTDQLQENADNTQMRILLQYQMFKRMNELLESMGIHLQTCDEKLKILDY